MTHSHRPPRPSLLLTALIALIALTLTLGTACSRRPPLVLSRHDMALLLADIHQAEGYIDQNAASYPGDSARLRMRQAVYDRHGVSAMQVDSSLAWYGYHMDRFLEVYDEVLTILDARLADVRMPVPGEQGREQVSMAVEGDTAEIWRSYRPTFFSPRRGRQFITANISRDRFWERGDTYELRFKTLRTQGPVEASLTAIYEGGRNTAVSRTSTLSTGWVSLRLPLDSARRARSLILTIRHQAAPSTPAATFSAIDSLTITRFRRPSS